MNDTIDTLKIKAVGDSESAVKSLDKVISTLERIKGVTQSRSLTTLTTHLSSLSSVVSNIKTNNLSKLTEFTSALSNIKDLNMSASLPFRMRELIDSLKGIGDVDVSKVERVSDALNRLSQAKDVKIPKTVSNENTEQLKRHTDEMKRLTSETKKSTAGTTKFGKAVKEAFNHTAVGHFTKLIKELGHIALYRIMRTMIKQVTEAFKTGIDDMYQYSKTFGGEYARSMDQIASANLTFKNSIGAIMAPIINLVAPWLDKLVDKLLDINNTIAMVIAGLSGKSTYSKAVRVTTEYAKAANQASDNTEKVTEKVEELKRSLAGLDEITIIGYKETSPLTAAGSVADNADTGLDYGSMFVETPVDMAKVNEIKEKLEDILEIAKWIGIAIAAWEFGKFILGIGQAIAEIGRLKAGIALMITGFSLEFSGGYHVGYGDAELKDYIKMALGSALGIAGSLLVFGANPVGLAIGITAAVLIGIASIYVGMEARLSDVVEQAFYDAGGTITISDLADQFERYCQAVINSNQPTIDLGAEIQNTINNTIRPAAEDIRTLGHAVALSGADTDKYMPRIIEQINNLDSGTQKVLDDVYDNIVRAVSGSLFDSLSDAGVYVPELLNTLARVKGETTKTVDEAIKEMQSLSTEFQNGSITGEEYHTKLESLTTQIESLTGATDPAKTALENAKLAVEGVDWQNKTASDSAFSKIAESALSAKDSINDAYIALEGSIAVAKTWSDDPDYQLYLNEILKAKETERNQQLNDLNDYMNDFMGDLQDDLISKMGSVAEEINAEYQDNWWAQIFNSEDQYLDNGLVKYKENTIDPITDKIKDLYAELGFEGETFASEAATKTLNGMFHFNLNAVEGKDFRNIISSTGTSMSDAIKDAYTDIGRNVPDGLIKGLEEKADAPVKATMDIAEKMQDAITGSQAFDIHSPSKKAEKYGEYIDLGYANGIDGKKNIVVSALDNMLNTMLNRLETFTNRWRSAINTMLDDMAYAWGNADFRSDGSYSYKYLAQRSIQRFAQGGFPEDGFFYANHNELVGQFTNGRTAVANNEQIVEGIAGGVASANEEQNALLREQNRLLRLLYEKDSSIDVGTIRAAFSRENKRNGKVGVPVSV